MVNLHQRHEQQFAGNMDDVDVVHHDQCEVSRGAAASQLHNVENSSGN